MPLEANSQIKLNDWGNFIIKGDLGFIRDGNEYDLQLEEKKDNRGIHYVVASNPLIEMFNRDNLDEITTKMELEMLNLIMSSSQATYVNRAYPNYIKLIFENRADEIDCKNIYNVGKKKTC